MILLVAAARQGAGGRDSERSRAPAECTERRGVAHPELANADPTRGSKPTFRVVRLARVHMRSSAFTPPFNIHLAGHLAVAAHRPAEQRRGCLGVSPRSSIRAAHARSGLPQAATRRLPLTGTVLSHPAPLSVGDSGVGGDSAGCALRREPAAWAWVRVRVVSVLVRETGLVVCSQRRTCSYLRHGVLHRVSWRPLPASASGAACPRRVISHRSAAETVTLISSAARRREAQVRIYCALVG
ncbi:hypothetical protein BC834DRAFT_322685 [Gloeopeniophorella convolvens]|nr:hypothetical protein BC834DRAFT_322685 [Gloeopeniophorella convolvens]